MTEWKLFDGDVAHVSTFDFHEHRERAPHWEQAIHQDRLRRAATLVAEASRYALGDRVGGIAKIVDLGCGDGGLIAHLDNEHSAWMACVGYDFQPSNIVGWEQRDLLGQTFSLDFVANWPLVIDADVYVMTECLEHLTDPHEAVRRVRAREAQLVCSSPWTEHAGSHDECHAWAWDPDGYEQLVRDAGFDVQAHDRVGMFQVMWAVPRA